MSDAVKIELSAEAKDIIRRFGAADWLLGAVRSEMDTQNKLTADAISENRLSGKGPFPVGEHRLGERTHRLRPSLRRGDSEVIGTSVVGSVGTNVEYAGAHEFGVDQEVTVSGHSRKRFEVQTFVGVGKRRPTRRVRKEDRFVGAFKRHMRIPARAPITTGVEERIPALGAAISQAIVDSWAQQGAGGNSP